MDNSIGTTELFGPMGAGEADGIGSNVISIKVPFAVKAIAP